LRFFSNRAVELQYEKYLIM
jgi:hypothetical protein